jgi:hypothetical protein
LKVLGTAFKSMRTEVFLLLEIENFPKDLGELYELHFIWAILLGQGREGCFVLQLLVLSQCATP